MSVEYTTENITSEIIHDLFPNTQILCNKQVPNSGIKTRPDFYIPTENLIVEFDGFQHYNSSSVILRDRRKDVRYGEMGIKVIRIPYFVQLNHHMQVHLFGRRSVIDVEYQHGFIDPKALLPADFCELGIMRFVKDLDKYEIVYNDIVHSLQLICESKLIEEVLPPSLFFLSKPEMIWQH